MGRCSYTWKEKDRGTGQLVEKCCQNETWEGSYEYCIFHDLSPDKDVDLFKEKLRKQIQAETEYHNFIGYYFPENWSFSGQEFEFDADFWGATFHDSYFKRATFRGVNFNEATFQGADFEEATFAWPPIGHILLYLSILQGVM